MPDYTNYLNLHAKTPSTEEGAQVAKNILNQSEPLIDQFDSGGQGVDHVTSHAKIPSTESTEPTELTESTEGVVQDKENILKQSGPLSKQSDSGSQGVDYFNSPETIPSTEKVVQDAKENILSKLKFLSDELGSGFKDALKDRIEGITGDQKPEQVLKDLEGFVEQFLQDAEKVETDKIKVETDKIEAEFSNLLNNVSKNKYTLKSEIKKIVDNTEAVDTEQVDTAKSVARKDAKEKILNLLKPLSDALGPDFKDIENKIEGITGDQKPEQVLEDIKELVKQRLPRLQETQDDKIKDKIKQINEKFRRLHKDFCDKKSKVEKEIGDIIRPEKRAIQEFIDKANLANKDKNKDKNSVLIELNKKNGQQADTPCTPCKPTWPGKQIKVAFNELIGATRDGRPIQWDARDARDFAEVFNKIQDNLLRYGRDIPGIIGALLILLTMAELLRLSRGHKPVSDLNEAIKCFLSKSENPGELAKIIAKMQFQDTSRTNQAKTLGELFPQLFASYMSQPSSQKASQQEKVNSNSCAHDVITEGANQSHTPRTIMGY